MKKKISIVLPVFNEKDNLEKTIFTILNLEKFVAGYSLEIVISDSHSTDGTSEIARKISEKHKNIHYINSGPGLGVGLYRGHKYAIKHINPSIMLQIDADGQVNPKVIIKLVRAIEGGYDLSLGSRFVKGGRNNLPFIRKIFSKGSSLTCRIIMGPWDIQEFTNSARAFTPQLFKKINWKRLPWKGKTFIMIPAFLNEAVIAGAKYKEVPLVFKNRPNGYSKNKVIRYTLSLILYAFKGRLIKLGII